MNVNEPRGGKNLIVSHKVPARGLASSGVKVRFTAVIVCFVEGKG